MKSDGVYGNFPYKTTQFSFSFPLIVLLISNHGKCHNSLNYSGIFLHDPVSFVALVRPDLFTYRKGVVRVETQGICVGHTLLDQGLKKYILEIFSLD